MKIIVFGSVTLDRSIEEEKAQVLISGGGGRAALAASGADDKISVTLVASCDKDASAANNDALAIFEQNRISVRSVSGAQMSASLWKGKYMQVPAKTFSSSVILDAEQAIKDMELIHDVAIFIGSMAVMGVNDMTQAAKQVTVAGTTVILDLNCRGPLTVWDQKKGKSIVNTWAQCAHIVKIGVVDLLYYDDGSWELGKDNADKAARRFLDTEGSVTKLVFVTNHGAPAVAYWKEGAELKQLEIPTPPIANIPENKVGGGDAFDAGLAVTLVNNGIKLQQIQVGLTQDQIWALGTGANNIAGQTLNLYYNSKGALLPGELKFDGSPVDFVEKYAGFQGKGNDPILQEIQQSYLSAKTSFSAKQLGNSMSSITNLNSAITTINSVPVDDTLTTYTKYT